MIRSRVIRISVERPVMPKPGMSSAGLHENQFRELQSPLLAGSLTAQKNLHPILNRVKVF
jgi:hypothetical protein